VSKRNSVFIFKPFFFLLSDVEKNGDAAFIRREVQRNWKCPSMANTAHSSSKLEAGRTKQGKHDWRVKIFIQEFL
jgi:hypothetical protein